MFSRSGLPVVGVCPVEGEEISDYGVVEISNEKVEMYREKPDIESARANTYYTADTFSQTIRKK